MTHEFFRPPRPTLKLVSYHEPDPDKPDPDDPARLAPPVSTPEVRGLPIAQAKPSPRWSLGQFWEWYLRPIKAVAGKERNCEQIQDTLRLWTTATHDPPLGEINVGLLTQWVRWLATRSGQRTATLSSATIHKHCRTLQSLLNAAGPPRGSRHQIAAGAIELVPFIPRPELVYQTIDEDCLSLAEIARLWQAAEQMHRPTLRPSVFWRSLLLASYYTGLRRETLLLAEWSWLRVDEHGEWLMCPAGTVKAKKTPHWCPIPPLLHEQLAELRKLTGQGKRLFPWTLTRGYFDDQRRELWLLAGLGKERGYRNALHGIRKRAATEMSRIDARLVDLFLGHSKGDIALTHYVKREALVPAVAKLPPLPLAPKEQPAAPTTTKPRRNKKHAG